MAETVTGRLVQCPGRPGRQLWHEEPAFLHKQLPHRPALLHVHLQQFLTAVSLFIHKRFKSSTCIIFKARVLYYIIFKSHNYMLYTSTLEIALCKFAFSNCAKKFRSRVNLASQFRNCVNLAAQKKGLQFLICSVQYRNYINLQIARNVYLHMTVHVTSCFVWVEHSKIFYLAILRIHK